MSYALNMDNSQVKKYTSALREMHRSNFPLVVRATLNDLAFDAKQKELPLIEKNKFTIRQKNFFKSHTMVEKAVGFDINTMHAEVGINPGKSTAAKDLTKQEVGGNRTKPFIYMRQARLGASNKRMVLNQYRDNKFKLNDNGRKFRSKKAAFVAKAIMAKRLNTPFLHETKAGQTLFDVKGVYLASGGKVAIKALPIADYEPNRSFNIKATHFVELATKKSYLKQSMFFIKNAKKRIERSMQ